ncbi:MAG TPA: serine hydrolase [Gemmatales bacterium]|nr:serine hydrolase [Gemmatales bacterium]
MRRRLSKMGYLGIVGYLALLNTFMIVPRITRAAINQPVKLSSAKTLNQQVASADALLQTAIRRIVAMQQQFKPEDVDWFAPSFFKTVTQEELIKLFQQQHIILGEIERTRICRTLDAHSGEIELISKLGYRLRAAIRLEPEPPHRCYYLVFNRIDTGSDTWELLQQDMAKLPGKHGAAVVELKPTRKTLFDYQADTPLAVGSSFKLLVLLQLCDEIAAGKRKWQDIVNLCEAGRSLPAGILQDWPPGSPVTLHTLAALMLSRSDNTAADHLMLTVGRQRLENKIAELSLKEPARNIPFLRTSELFKLKLIAPESLAEQYSSMNKAERHSVLQKLCTIELQAPRVYKTPRFVDSIEWFFTGHDLIRIVENLYDSAEKAKALEILAITRPFDIDDYSWDYLGFKGGAETGVLNLTLLGKLRKNQSWYVTTFTWNNTETKLDEAKWIEVVSRALLIIERQSTR